jgi:hypothetical protein
MIGEKSANPLMVPPGETKNRNNCPLAPILCQGSGGWMLPTYSILARLFSHRGIRVKQIGFA